MMRLWMAGRVLMLAVLLLIVWMPRAYSQLRTIAAVVDGERVLLSDGSKMRLAGVDTPELHPSAESTREAVLTGKSEEAVRRQGEIAAAYLRMLALGKPVLVELDRTANAASYRPAYLYITDEKGRVAYSLNERMIEDGYASRDTSRRFALEREYEALEVRARKEGRGFWAHQPAYGIPTPPKSRPSEGADLFSLCRTDPGCVWVGRLNGSGGAVGHWASRPGHTCPCVDL